MLSSDSTNSTRNRCRLPLRYIFGNHEFDLLVVGRDSFKGNAIILFRYGGTHTSFWMQSNKQKHTMTKLEETPQASLDTYIQGYWNFAVYCAVREVDNAILKMDYLLINCMFCSL